MMIEVAVMFALFIGVPLLLLYVYSTFGDD